MKKIIKILVLFLFFVFITYRYFYYVDLSNDCYLKIKPSLMEFSNTNIKRAIKTLKHGSPDDYNKLCVYVDTIDPNLSCGGFGGGCFYPSKKSARTIDISTSQRDLAWTAAIIMHETCHSMQFQQDRTLSEQECYEVDDATIKQIVKFPDE